MDLFDLAKACARRWYVFVPLMLATIFVGYRAYTGVEPVYYSTTTVGLANPSVTGVQTGSEVRENGLVSAGGAVLLSNILAMSLKDESISRQVAAAGGDPNYTASVFELGIPGQQLPLVTITATTPDPGISTKTVELVAAQAVPLLKQMQQSAGVPEDQMLISYSVVPLGDPVQATPSRTRSTVALLLACTGLSVVATALLDSLMLRRKRVRLDREGAVVSSQVDAHRRSHDDREWESVVPPTGKGVSEEE